MTTNGTTTPIVHQDLAQELAALRAENTRLKALALAKATSKLVVKIKPIGQKTDKGEEMKGNVAVYGLGRYPVTLYAGQWQRLLAMKDTILAEIEAHKDVLSWNEAE